MKCMCVFHGYFALQKAWVGKMKGGLMDMEPESSSEEEEEEEEEEVQQTNKRYGCFTPNIVPISFFYLFFF